jgi:hypothetical protein
MNKIESFYHLNALIQSPVSNGQLLRILHQLRPSNATVLAHHITNSTPYTPTRLHLIRKLFDIFDSRLKLVLKPSSTQLFAIFAELLHYDRILLLFSSVYDDLITDSALRSRFWRVYLHAPLGSLIIRSVYKFRCAWLSSYYEYFIKSCKPDYVVVSHTTYVCYGLLERIAKDKGIPVFCIPPHRAGHLINEIDQHHLQYLIYFSIRSNKLSNKLEESISNLPNRSTHARTIYNDYEGERTLSNYIASFAHEIDNQTLERCRPAFFVALHCIRDMNHLLSGHKLFDDYFKWLKYTLDALSLNTSMPVFICPHPFHDAYAESSFVHRFISRYTNSYPHISLFTHEKRPSLQGSLFAPIILTCAGSISLESASLGIRSVVCETSPVPQSSSLQMKSRDSYMELLQKSFSVEEWSSLFRCTPDSRIKEIPSAVHNMGKPTRELYQAMVFLDDFEVYFSKDKRSSKLNVDMSDHFFHTYVHKLLGLMPQPTLILSNSILIPHDSDAIISFSAAREEVIRSLQDFVSTHAPNDTL